MSLIWLYALISKKGDFENFGIAFEKVRNGTP
jgi:hypothetical protein